MSERDVVPFRAGLIAVFVGLVVLALKVAAALRTGSLALAADAAESVVNVVAALVATAAVRASIKTSDPRHGYGHGKLEFLSAAIEGSLVVLAAFVIAFEAIARFGGSPAIRSLGIGLLLSAVATGCNVLLARFLERVGKQGQAPALLADAMHLRNDVVVSLLVYAGLGVAWLSGTWTLDSLLALAVAVHILISGVRAVRHSLAEQVEEGLDADEIRQIESRLASYGPPVIGFDGLQATRSGHQVGVRLRLVISRYALVYEAHEICDRVEADLLRLHPGARVSIQVEPEGTSPGLGGSAEPAGND